MIRFSHHRTIPESLQEYGRGIAGGLMFSLPLLYTMEVWWSGFMLHPWRIVAYVVATFGILLFYNRFAGLRRDATLREVAIDSVEEMGIGIVLATLVLFLTNRLDWEADHLGAVGKIAMEAMTVAIGVSVGTAQLGASDGGDCGVSGEDEDPKHKPDSYLPQSALALCGAVLFAANVAPTDEVSVIAMESPSWKLLLIALFSMLVGMLILFFAEFRGSSTHVARGSVILGLRGVFTTYGIALGSSAALLWFFGKLDDEPLSQCVAQTVVLGLPAVLGASAGRLLLQGGQGGGGEDGTDSEPSQT